jgi:hypothetical protein
MKDRIPKSSGDTRRMRASVVIEHNDALVLKELSRKSYVLPYDII